MSHSYWHGGGILGITLIDGNTLKVDPALPDGWDGFSATVNIANNPYQIVVQREAGRVQVSCNGQSLEGGRFALQQSDNDPGGKLRATTVPAAP